MEFAVVVVVVVVTTVFPGKCKGRSLLDARLFGFSLLRTTQQPTTAHSNVHTLTFVVVLCVCVCVSVWHLSSVIGGEVKV